MSDGQNSKIANLINRKSNIKIQILLEKSNDLINFDRLVPLAKLRPKANAI